jgi:hypothetical protein
MVGYQVPAMLADSRSAGISTANAVCIQTQKSAILVNIGGCSYLPNCLPQFCQQLQKQQGPQQCGPCALWYGLIVPDTIFAFTFSWLIFRSAILNVVIARIYGAANI